MLGLAKLGPASWSYYARESTREDYWAGSGEEHGTWLGRGSAAAGLEGRMSTDELRRLFGEGRHPTTGEVLGRPLGERSVAGFALSLSPPKSV
jgi:hypothetical protein